MTSSSRPWRAARYMAHRGARCLPVGSASVEARLGLEPWAGLSRAGCSAQPHPPRAGLLAADRKHWRPGGHPHALLHHRPLLLRWLQARASACQPHPGEQVLPARWAPRARARAGSSPPHLLSRRLSGITSGLTPTNSWPSQDSSSTPTGRATAAACRPPPTTPRRGPPHRTHSTRPSLLGLLRS